MPEHATALEPEVHILDSGNARVELAEATRFEHGLVDTEQGEMFQVP